MKYRIIIDYFLSKSSVYLINKAHFLVGLSKKKISIVAGLQIAIIIVLHWLINSLYLLLRTWIFIHLLNIQKSKPYCRLSCLASLKLVILTPGLLLIMVLWFLGCFKLWCESVVSLFCILRVLFCLVGMLLWYNTYEVLLPLNSDIFYLQHIFPYHFYKHLK